MGLDHRPTKICAQADAIHLGARLPDRRGQQAEGDDEAAEPSCRPPGRWLSVQAVDFGTNVDTPDAVDELPPTETAAVTANPHSARDAAAEPTNNCDSVNDDFRAS